MCMQVRLTFVVTTLETQPLQPATVGGGARGPNSRSSCRPMLMSRPSCPAGAASCNPYGCPVLSNPMGKASAAYQAENEQANPATPCTQHCCLDQWKGKAQREEKAQQKGKASAPCQTKHEQATPAAPCTPCGCPEVSSPKALHAG